MRLPYLGLLLFLNLNLNCNFKSSVSNTAEFHVVLGDIVSNKMVKSKEGLLSEMERLNWAKMTEAGIIIDSENYLKFKFIKKDDRSNLYSLTQNKKGNKLSIEYLGNEDAIKSILLTYFEKYEEYEIAY